MKTKPYNPTDLDRCKAVSLFNFLFNPPYDYPPSAYKADGATVTDPDGFTVWAVTLAEAKEVGIVYDPSETVIVGRRKWIVVNA